MTFVRVTRDRKLYVRRHRCHHGAIGALAVAVGLKTRTFAGGVVAALGAIAMWHDRRDFARSLWVLDA